MNGINDIYIYASIILVHVLYLRLVFVKFSDKNPSLPGADSIDAFEEGDAMIFGAVFWLKVTLFFQRKVSASSRENSAHC